MHFEADKSQVSLILDNEIQC